MNSTESQMYDLGRQARRGGFETFTCNLNNAYKKGFWLAGWHDEDIEMGNYMYFPTHTMNYRFSGEAA